MPEEAAKVQEGALGAAEERGAEERGAASSAIKGGDAGSAALMMGPDVWLQAAGVCSGKEADAGAHCLPQPPCTAGGAGGSAEADCWTLPSTAAAHEEEDSGAAMAGGEGGTSSSSGVPFPAAGAPSGVAAAAVGSGSILQASPQPPLLLLLPPLASNAAQEKEGGAACGPSAAVAAVAAEAAEGAFPPPAPPAACRNMLDTAALTAPQMTPLLLLSDRLEPVRCMAIGGGTREEGVAALRAPCMWEAARLQVFDLPEAAARRYTAVLGGPALTPGVQC